MMFVPQSEPVTCDNCDGTRPGQMQVVLSGWSDANLNGTFVLDWTDCSGGPCVCSGSEECAWAYNIGGICTDAGSPLTLTVRKFGANYTAAIEINGVIGCYVLYTRAFGATKPTCSGFSSESFSSTGTLPTGCTRDGSAALVTAL